MNKLKKILFAFLCIFVMKENVFAAPVAGYATGASDSAGAATSSSGSNQMFIPTGYGVGSHFIAGLRVSVTKADGSLVCINDYLRNDLVKIINDTTQAEIDSANSDDADYYNDYDYPHIYVYLSYQNGSKPSPKYINNSGYIKYPQTNNSTVKSMDRLDRIFSGIVDVNSAASNGTLSSIVHEMAAITEYEKVANVFDSLCGTGTVTRNTKTDSNGKVYHNLFLVIEPLAIVKYNYFFNNKVFEQRLYVGTMGEFKSSYSVGGVIAAKDDTYTYPGGTTDGWGYVKGALMHNAGCTAYLENSDSFGTAVSDKFPTEFQPRTYFKDKLRADDRTAVLASNCSSVNVNTLISYAGDSKSPFAIEIFWFDQAGTGTPSLNCNTINQFYSKLWRFDIDNAILNLKIVIQSYGDRATVFDSFNKDAKEKGLTFPSSAPNGITPSWYKENCMKNPGDEPDEYRCTVEYNVSNCDSNNNIKYTDSSDWAHCVTTDENNVYNIETHKTADNRNGAALSYRDESLSSKYCDVYCIETVSTKLDSDKPTVLAGNHFIWGNNSSISSKRECRTYNLNTTQFYSDLKAASEEVLKAIAENDLNDAIDDTGTDGWSDNGDCNCRCPNGQYYEDAPTLADPDPQPYCHTREECDDDYKWDGPDSASASGIFIKSDASKETITGSVSLGEVTSCNNTSWTPSSDDYDLSDAQDYVEFLISEYKKCSNFADTSVLNDMSYAKISYDNDVYKYGPKEMKSRQQTEYSETKTCAEYSVADFSDCSESGCDDTDTVNRCTFYSKTGYSDKYFTMPDNVYRYVLKTKEGLSVKSVHSIEGLANPNFTLNYIDLGYSNFPVAYKTPDRTYPNGLKIEYGMLGHTKDGEDTGVDKILKSTTGDYGTWSCDYTVYSEIIPPSGGVDIIYREIDLYDPFPDTDASKRATGANWCDSTSCAWNNKTSTAYILENRGVTGDDLYKQKPMYVFELTPTAIINIRRYNKANQYSSYTGSLNGKYYDYACKTSTGRQCISGYLTELIDKYGKGGVCSIPQARNTGETSTFESCRY